MRLRRSRSSITGEFVSAATAKANPAETVTETIPGPDIIGAVLDALLLAMEVEHDLDRVSPQTLSAYYEACRARGKTPK